MPWLDRLNDRQTRRFTRDLRHQAVDTRDMALHRLTQFGHDASHVASQAGHAAGDIASRAAHLAADYGRHEGTALAQAATAHALRAGRAMKADPIPAIVGAVGIVLLASLLFGRRT
ncbi:MAG: hypothetical protein ABI398_03795 [Devosia sp.]